MLITVVFCHDSASLRCIHVAVCTTVAILEGGEAEIALLSAI